MPRIKPVEIASKEECVTIINNIARLEVERRSKENELAKAIQDLQDKFGPEIVAIKESIEGKIARARAYVESHEGTMLLPGRKSGETALADYGFRVGNPTLKLVKKWKWDEVLATIKKDILMSKYVRVKEDIKKDEIKADFSTEKLSNMTLATFGMKIVQDEAFWIEPKADKAAAV